MQPFFVLVRKRCWQCLCGCVKTHSCVLAHTVRQNPSGCVGSCSRQQTCGHSLTHPGCSKLYFQLCSFFSLDLEGNQLICSAAHGGMGALFLNLSGREERNTPLWWLQVNYGIIKTAFLYTWCWAHSVPSEELSYLDLKNSFKFEYLHLINFTIPACDWV